jgi:hypothetical protein
MFAWTLAQGFSGIFQPLKIARHLTDQRQLKLEGNPLFLEQAQMPIGHLVSSPSSWKKES